MSVGGGSFTLEAAMALVVADPLAMPRLRLLVASRGISPVGLSDDQLLAYVVHNRRQLVSVGGASCSCELGEELTQLLVVGPVNAATAKLLADQTLAEANEVLIARGWPAAELHNGRADAWRHCCWSCRMAKAIGAIVAKRVGDIHECCGANPASEIAMDLYNNAVGRSLGDGLGEFFTGNCREDCLKAIDEGNLIVRPGTSATHPLPGAY